MKEPYYVYSTIVSPENYSVLDLVKKAALRTFCHSTTASVCDLGYCVLTLLLG